MKNRGVFITILLILVLGAGITFRMHQFVTENTVSSVSKDQEMEMPEEAAAEEKSFAVSAAAADPGASAGEQSDIAAAAAGGMLPKTEAVMETEKAADEALPDDTFSRKAKMAPGETLSGDSEAAADDDAAMAEAAGEETVLSPLAAAPGSSVSEEALTAEDYRKKLEDVDQIVKDLRETDGTANTTDSVKNIAEYEYRLWDTELNRVYQAVISAMSENEAEKLRSEERQWIRSRDQMAKQAAAKLKGGTMESLEYTASLSVSTRERAYELLEDYGELLPAKEKSD
ncbi:MAG: lysozyme inhibitor LprI family protein [Clostridium sp.]|nr:lysozyme inhibitor LprI family protein [Clostridium sp.]